MDGHFRIVGALLGFWALAGGAPLVASDVVFPPADPDRIVQPVDSPWLVRGQGESRLAAFESADTFGELAATSGACADDCDCPCGFGTWHDNTSIFLAADAWRTRADDDYPGSRGFRTGFNTGLGLCDHPLRLQIGGSYAGYDLSGRDGDSGADTLHANSVEQQLFFTGGVYRRSDVACGERCAWGAVLDVNYDNHFGEQAQELFVTQFRGIIGFAVNECNELGFWGASRTNWQRFDADVGTFRVRGLSQGSLFWHHNWTFGGDTWLSVGAGEEPAEWILALNGQAPLSPSVALFGGVTWGIPSAPAGDPNDGDDQNYSEEYWNVSFGLVWYPGYKAENDTVSGHRGLPLLPVADNGSFLVFARPGNL